MVVPEKTVVRLPDNLSYEEGALIEPVANAMYAVRNSVVPITENTTICIIGAGPIGLGDLLCAQLYSPKLLVMVDISDYSLETARRMIHRAKLGLNDGGNFCRGLTGYMRLNAACPRSVLEKAMEQLKDAVDSL